MPVMATIYLAEAEVEAGAFPLEVVPLFGRAFLHPGDGPEEVPLGEHPLYGAVRARAVARGEVRDHPLFARAAESLRRAYLSARAQGQEEEARRVRERARGVGLEGALEEVEEEARRLEKVGLALRVGRVPASYGDGGFRVGQPPAFTLSTLEEAERVAALYAWAREAGVSLRPLPRGKDGGLRFAVALLALKAENGEARLPARGRRGPYRLRRTEGGLVLEGVPPPPKGAYLLYLPWERGA